MRNKTEKPILPFCSYTLNAVIATLPVEVGINSVLLCNMAEHQWRP